VQTASPIVLCVALLVVSLFLIRVDYASGCAGILIATLGYGARTTLTQVRHIERGDTLARQRSQLQEIARTDALTGVANRYWLDRELRAACRGERSAGQPLSLLMIDIDHFKQFNDAHGHHVGDQVLKLAAARLARIEGGGQSYRYGGEEFCVIFPDRSLKEAWPHLERLRKDIEDYKIAVRGGDRPKAREAGSRLRAARPPEKTLSVTVSIGVAERDDTLIRPALVIRAADEALYRAKGAGRNRVMR